MSVLTASQSKLTKKYGVFAGVSAVGLYWLYAAWTFVRVKQGFEVFHVPGTCYWNSPRLFAMATDAGVYVASALFFAVSSMAGLFALVPVAPQELSFWEDSLLLLAGFVPGYLMTIVCVRAATILLPNAGAWGLIAAACGATALLWLRKGSWRRYRPESWALAVGLFFLAMIVQIQVRDTHVVGDASSFFLDFIRDNPLVFSPWGRLPLVSQHYDELVYLFPLLSLMKATHGEPVALYWILGAAGRIGCLGLCLISLRAWLPKWEALAVTLFLFFGTQFFWPLDTLLNFDAGNPVGLAMHIGRQLASILPIVFLALLPRVGGWVRDPQATLLLVLLGAGIGSTTFSTIVIVFYGVVVAVLLAAEKSAPTAKAESRALAIFAGVLVAVPAMAYPIEARSEVGLSLLGCAIFALCVVSWLSFGRALKLGRGLWKVPSVRAMSVLCGGLAVSYLFMGNLVLSQVKVLAFLPSVDRNPGFSTPHGGSILGLSPYCSQWATDHCSDFSSFSAHYGFGILLWALALAWMSTRPSASGAPRGNFWAKTFGGRSPSLVLVGAILLLVSFVAYDFLNGRAGTQLDVWVKSRLVEPWFYLGQAVSWVILLRLGGKARKLALVGLGVYTVFPQLLDPLNSLPVQWFANAQFWAQHLLGRG